MISNTDYSDKSPYTWLVWGDKAAFTTAWFIVECIAIWVSYQYEWQIMLTTALFFTSVLAALIVYRYNDYRERVKNMDILSFSTWRRLKKEGHV